MKRARVVIVGAGGYTGAELASLLLGHGGAEIVGLFGSARRQDEPALFHHVHPQFHARLELPVLAADPGAIVELAPDVVFLATPHEASVTLARDLLGLGLRVIDLSGAFRLPDPGLYPTYYGFEHEAVDLLERAVYGLPEINRGAIRGAELVAAPGCYPTTAVLPIHALARAGAIRAGTRVIVDSVSGVSGAGRSAKQANLYCEVSQRPYGVLTHRHQPEIAVHSGAEVLFTPHVGPFDRGMLSTIHVDLDDDVSAGRIAEVFDAAYGREPFVRLREHGDWPTVLGVVRTNFCDIAWAMDKTGAGGHLIVFSAIDNLVKGASGQGVQCMNLMLGLDETEGLGGARQGALLDRVREGAGAT